MKIFLLFLVFVVNQLVVRGLLFTKILLADCGELLENHLLDEIF
jgi:hypothetical protein